MHLGNSRIYDLAIEVGGRRLWILWPIIVMHRSGPSSNHRPLVVAKLDFRWMCRMVTNEDRMIDKTN